MTPFLSNPLKALVKGTVTNSFPSVTSVLQRLLFKMFFHAVLFIAPSPSPGRDEKVILIFQRSPINYNTGLCIAYSLHISLFYFLKLIFGDYLLVVYWTGTWWPRVDDERVKEEKRLILPGLRSWLSRSRESARNREIEK